LLGSVVVLILGEVKVVVKFLQEFYSTIGRYSLEVTLAEGATIRDLIEYIDKNVKKSFKNLVLDSKGGIRYPVEIALNGRRIEFLEGLETMLKNGDTIVFSPRAFFVL